MDLLGRIDMGDQELRDKGGKLLGRIKQRSDGKLEGRDAGGRLKGTYDPKVDQTRDPGGKLIGKGNLLAVLVTSP
jgi:hypothetical protein